MGKSEIWHHFLENIKNIVTPFLFETWFAETELVHLSDDMQAIITVPSKLHIRHLSDKYADIIEETLNEVTGTNFNIKYVLKTEADKYIKNLENNVETTYSEEDELLGAPTIKSRGINLNSNYTFENYIVGESNKFARTAAVAVAEQPGVEYNPLFIYGSSGLGKTHLMHAIGNYIVNNHEKSVLYVTSEQFVTEFIESLGGGKVSSFKEKFRHCDVLIIDDIQFLSKKTQSQEEFFHTFNVLHQTNKQIIISSDRSPMDLKLLEERLRTRFTWGLSVNIYPPNLETRKAILKKKIITEGLIDEISDDVVEYIANQFDSDVRQLEGALRRLFAYATMMNKYEITLDLAVEALKDITNSKVIKSSNSITRIQQQVADYYKISVEDLKSKKRTRSIVFPRHIAVYLCRELTEHSFEKIALEFGGRDHSTIISSHKKINSLLLSDEDIKKVITELKGLLK